MWMFVFLYECSFLFREMLFSFFVECFFLMLVVPFLLFRKYLFPIQYDNGRRLKVPAVHVWRCQRGKLISVSGYKLSVRTVIYKLYKKLLSFLVDSLHRQTSFFGFVSFAFLYAAYRSVCVLIF